MHAWLDDSDDHLRWIAPTDLNLDYMYMGITHLDCVTLVLQDSGREFGDKLNLPAKHIQNQASLFQVFS